MTKAKPKAKQKQAPAKPKIQPKIQPKSQPGREPKAKTKEEPPHPVERTEEELVDLTSRVYKLVVERGKDGVLQSEIWKELGLTSRDGSRLAIRLERRGLIGRVKVLEEGRWTYKLTPLRFPTNMASIEKAPCIVCLFESKCAVDGQISPYICPLVGSWVIEEARVARGQFMPTAVPSG
ncbi:MAG: MarR family winged helix-turn-helix transcriptional regulator [Nitrososphaerales archaeon]|jgi:predicted DNA-binding transcriptional regulator